MSDYELDSLLRKATDLEISGKISEMVDECPVGSPRPTICYLIDSQISRLTPHATDVKNQISINIRIYSSMFGRVRIFVQGHTRDRAPGLRVLQRDRKDVRAIVRDLNASPVAVVRINTNLVLTKVPAA